MNGMDPRLSFNEIAALYDKARPDYPDALFDDVYAAAGLAPRDAVLDVGCGSGQATVGWARRDLALTALDPGDDLLASRASGWREPATSVSFDRPSRRGNRRPTLRSN